MDGLPLIVVDIGGLRGSSRISNSSRKCIKHRNVIDIACCFVLVSGAVDLTSRACHGAPPHVS